jgi:hypothetical protein
MTLTYEKLKGVVTAMKSQGFKTQISDPALDKIIIRNVGASEYVIKGTKQALGRAGMIKRNISGAYDILADD